MEWIPFSKLKIRTWVEIKALFLLTCFLSFTIYHKMLLANPEWHSIIINLTQGIKRFPIESSDVLLTHCRARIWTWISCSLSSNPFSSVSIFGSDCMAWTSCLKMRSIGYPLFALVAVISPCDLLSASHSSCSGVFLFNKIHDESNIFDSQNCLLPCSLDFIVILNESIRGIQDIFSQIWYITAIPIQSFQTPKSSFLKKKCG